MKITINNDKVYGDNNILKELSHQSISENLVMIQKEHNEHDMVLYFLADSPEYKNEFQTYLQDEENYRNLIKSGVHTIVETDEHIIGYTGGYMNDEHILLMRGVVKQNYKSNSVMTKMIKVIEDKFPNAELIFNKVSDEAQYMIDNNFPYAKVHCSNC